MEGDGEAVERVSVEGLWQMFELNPEEDAVQLKFKQENLNADFSLVASVSG